VDRELGRPADDEGYGDVVIFTVIAGAAKQSIYPRVEAWIASLRSQ
jgi:hypothetical protein